jgi:hyperosmotically inducible periplasmic protein
MRMTMKSFVSILLAAGMLAVLGTAGAQAQTASSGETAQSAGASGAVSVKAANRALKKQVVRALTRTKGLQSSAITVRVNNGVITLEGTVPEQSQMDLATRAAQGVPGVTSVKNALTLSTF